MSGKGEGEYSSVPGMDLSVEARLSLEASDEAPLTGKRRSAPEGRCSSKLVLMVLVVLGIAAVGSRPLYRGAAVLEKDVHACA
eukprot:COSAG03_NODE_17414_length_376_cov_0.736462_1_plen_82_part_10